MYVATNSAKNKHPFKVSKVNIIATYKYTFKGWDCFYLQVLLKGYKPTDAK